MKNEQITKCNQTLTIYTHQNLIDENGIELNWISARYILNNSELVVTYSIYVDKIRVKYQSEIQFWGLLCAQIIAV